MFRSISVSDRVVNILIIAVVTLIGLLSFYPIWYTLSLSFSDSVAAKAGMVHFMPVGFNFSAYHFVLDDHKFYRAFLISIERVLLGGAIQFVITVTMAYPLSRETKHFPDRNLYMWLLVFCMLFSGGLIPLYLTVTTLGLQDSIWALVIPNAVPLFNVILLMNFFRNLPKELDDAALVDGSGAWNSLVRLYIPMSKPALATVTLFSIVNHWNSFFDGLIYMNDPKNYPLQTYIQQLVVKVSNNAMAQMTTQQLINLMKMSDETLNAAKIVVAMIPILLIYPFLQRYFVHGIVLGSIKE